MSWLRRLFDLGEAPPDPSAPVCVACGSVELKVLVPEVYDCLACGHEGGDGRAAYAFALWEAAVAGWPEDRRRRETRTRLVEARRHLENALGSFEAASSLVSYAAEDGGTSAQDQAYFEGSMHVQQALARLRQALVLDPELELGGVRLIEVETGAMRPHAAQERSVPGALLEALVTNHAGTHLPDLVGHGDVRRAKVDTAALRDQLSTALAGYSSGAA